MSRQNILNSIFVGVIAGLLLQFFVAKKYEEPYPAIVFPGFGQVYDDLYPYDFERLRLYAYTTRDSVELTMNEVFAPFTEDALFAPMRVRLKSLPDTLTLRNGAPPEQELLHYLQQRTNALVGEPVQRLALVFHEYQATNGTQARLVSEYRKRIEFL